jgi:hypothetical protein
VIGSTISYAGIVGAGQTIPLSLTGTMFYLSVSTAPLYVRPAGQVWSQYQPGTGLDVSEQFSLLEVYNGSAKPVTFQIFAGPSEFIDHRALPNLQAPNVIHSVASEGGAGWSGGPDDWAASAPDLSGSSFQDAAGVTWLAIQRKALRIQTTQNNVNVVVSLAPIAASPIEWVQSVTGATIEAGGVVAAPAEIDAIGNFYFSASNQAGTGALTNIYEIYSAVLQGFQGQPPS